MDTHIIITLLCNADKSDYRDMILNHCSTEDHWHTVEDMEMLYGESGWKAENEK